MDKFSIFSVEDDYDISHIINIALTKSGYNVKSFYDGETFLDELKTSRPDMVLLDLMLPGIQGSDILKEIRKDENGKKIVLIVVSAKSDIGDKINCLDLGADDYIEKPFDIKELLSRVNAHFRRYIERDDSLIKIQNLTLDTKNKKLFKADKEIELTSTEYKIMCVLFQNEGKVVNREDIVKILWRNESDLKTRTIDMHIKTLREKIKDPNKRIIKSIYGVGYIIE